MFHGINIGARASSHSTRQKMESSRRILCAELCALFSVCSLLTSARSAFLVSRNSRALAGAQCGACRNGDDRRLIFPLRITTKPLDDLLSAIDDDEEEDDESDLGPIDGMSSSPFIDVDQLYNTELPGPVRSLSDFSRDEDDILMEREDRFYIDEKGERRKVENCILVGVEDLSAKWRLQKQMNQNMRYAEVNNVAAVSSEDNNDNMLFTLEESLTEMRELIKTAGMVCVGGKSSDFGLIYGC